MQRKTNKCEENEENRSRCREGGQGKVRRRGRRTRRFVKKDENRKKDAGKENSSRCKEGGEEQGDVQGRRTGKGEWKYIIGGKQEHV